MSASRVFVVCVMAASIFVSLGMREYLAKAATSGCGSVADCAQAAATSAKMATDAELAMGAKIDVMAAEVKVLKEALARDEAALRAANGTNQRSGIGAAASADCPAGQFVAGLETGPLNPGHSDSPIGSLYLHCRNAIPPAN